MRDFFKGWRRKAGCVTLVMACAAMAGWMRSTVRCDLIAWNGTPWRYYAESLFGHLHFVRTPHLPRSPTFIRSANEPSGLYGYHRGADGTQTYNPMKADTFHWRCDFAGFHLSQATNRNLNMQLTRLIFPYWSIVLPLTLISAWLLLGKPRAPAHKSTEPAPTTGT